MNNRILAKVTTDATNTSQYNLTTTQILRANMDPNGKNLKLSNNKK